MTRAELFDRFLNKVQKTDSCWLWKAQIMPNGYGTFYMNSQNIGAHRASWLLFKGEIQTGLCVCHHCDTRDCVNPEHLFLGTVQQNTQDAMKKGRLASGSRNKSFKIGNSLNEEILSLHRSGMSQRQIAKKFNISQKTIWRKIHLYIPTIKDQRGENNGRSKLTASQVLEIRDLYKKPYSFEKLAKKFDISKTTATRIVKRKIWKHI